MRINYVLIDQRVHAPARVLLRSRRCPRRPAPARWLQRGQFVGADIHRQARIRRDGAVLTDVPSPTVPTVKVVLELLGRADLRDLGNGAAHAVDAGAGHLAKRSVAVAARPLKVTPWRWLLVPSTSTVPSGAGSATRSSMSRCCLNRCFMPRRRTSSSRPQPLPTNTRGAHGGDLLVVQHLESRQQHGQAARVVGDAGRTQLAAPLLHTQGRCRRGTRCPGGPR